MKKLVALFLVMGLPTMGLAANGITLGGGLNFSKTDQGDTDNVTRSSRIGYNFGAAYEAEIVPGFFLVPGMALETRGENVKDEDPDFGYDAKLNFKMTYLHFPVLGMLKFPVGNVVLNIFAGPSIGINLSSELTLEYMGNKMTFDTKDDTETFDFGLEFGAGIEIPTASGGFFFRPSYYVGLTDFVDGGEARLRSLKLALGYQISIPSK